MITFTPRVPRNAWTHPSAQAGGAATGRPRPPRPRPAPAAQRRAPKLAPTSRHTGPARHGWAPTPPRTSANTPSPSSTPTTAWPCADVQTRPVHDVGEPEIALRDLARLITRPPRRARRQIQRPQLRDLAAKRADRVRPSRSVRRITVAGILGLRRQQLTYPQLKPVHQRTPGVRRYFGGPALASAAFTVFLEMPMTRAISEIGMPAAAGGSLPNPPRPTPASSPARFKTGSRGNWSIFGCHAVVSFQLPSTFIASVSAGTPYDRADRLPDDQSV